MTAQNDTRNTEETSLLGEPERLPANPVSVVGLTASIIAGLSSVADVAIGDNGPIAQQVTGSCEVFGAIMSANCYIPILRNNPDARLPMVLGVILNTLAAASSAARFVNAFTSGDTPSMVTSALTAAPSCVSAMCQVAGLWKSWKNSTSTPAAEMPSLKRA